MASSQVQGLHIQGMHLTMLQSVICEFLQLDLYPTYQTTLIYLK